MSTPAPARWSAIAPLAAPMRLDPAYDRHRPDDQMLQAQLHDLLDDRDWSGLRWPRLLDALVGAGRTDVALSRLFEGHVDAVRILDQAGRPPVAGALYGVWASRSQRTGVRAASTGAQLVLDGTLRFASGLGVIDRALVPVWTGPDRHLLIDLDLSEVGGPELQPDTSQWQTAAMSVSRSHTLVIDGLKVRSADQVGPDNFYLDRPGFFPGGVGVAACWLGGATRVADLVLARMHDPVPPQLKLRLGEIRRQLSTGAAMVSAAGRSLDVEADSAQTERAEELDQRALSAETRWAVANAVHGVLDQAHRIAGPAGLAYDQDLTHAVHDLRLYVLQHNADAEALYLAEL